MTGKQKVKKITVGENIRVKLFTPNGKYITQILVSAEINIENKPLSVYYFSDNCRVKDCCQ